ncbi:glycosyltransferase [Anaerovibrio lipolyticus]|uniref:glycosyltransferase n=1 Tax=Anaerovibrio lipolyticus TaxID=82374 RepID=UPI0004852B9D|nr:glycosyltransferase [Anaerovibrio lipolyticus]
MRLLLANFTKMVGDTGGTAKVHCNFANVMQQRGYDVAMVYQDHKQGACFFPVNKEVRQYNICHYDGHDYTLPLSYRIRREMVRGFSKKMAATIGDEFIENYLLDNVRAILEKEQPDIIIAFQPAAAKVFLQDLKTDIPIILMCHGEAEDWFHNYPDKQVQAIKDCDVVQVLMPSFKKAITSRYPDTKTVVVGNVVPQFEKEDIGSHTGRHKITFIGRLARKHKRPHLLVEAFIPLASTYTDWDVEIWGNEDSRGYIKEMQVKIDSAGLQDRIKIMGTTHDVESVLRQGDIFVFPSAYEGFGLTIAEGMSVGLPAVAYASCPAVNELVHDGVDGFLVEDGVEPLREKIELLMSDMDLRVKMGAAAHEAMKEYSDDKIWATWESLIQETVNKADK